MVAEARHPHLVVHQIQGDVAWVLHQRLRSLENANRRCVPFGRRAEDRDRFADLVGDVDLLALRVERHSGRPVQPRLRPLDDAQRRRVAVDVCRIDRDRGKVELARTRHDLVAAGGARPIGDRNRHPLGFPDDVRRPVVGDVKDAVPGIERDAVRIRQSGLVALNETEGEIFLGGRLRIDRDGAFTLLGEVHQLPRLVHGDAEVAFHHQEFAIGFDVAAFAAAEDARLVGAVVVVDDVDVARGWIEIQIAGELGTRVETGDDALGLGLGAAAGVLASRSNTMIRNLFSSVTTTSLRAESTAIELNAAHGSWMKVSGWRAATSRRLLPSGSCAAAAPAAA